MRLGVRGREGLCDLDRVVERPAIRDGPAIEARAQGLAVQELGDDVRDRPVDADVEDGQDVRVIQRGGGARLPLETLEESGRRSEELITLSATSRRSRESRAR